MTKLLKPLSVHEDIVEIPKQTWKKLIKEKSDMQLSQYYFMKMILNLSIRMCHMSYVKCHYFFFFFFNKVVKLVVGGSVINRAYAV